MTICIIYMRKSPLEKLKGDVDLQRMGRKAAWSLMF